MNKGRTKKQDFELIKNVIQSNQDFNIFEIMENENIDFRYFFRKYKVFFFSNYMSEKRCNDSAKIVIQKVRKKGLYCDQLMSENRIYEKIDYKIDKTTVTFKRTTFTKALNLFVELEKTRKGIVDTLNSHAFNNTTYSDAFIDFCHKYNLKAGLERNNLKRRYEITMPLKKIIPKTDKQIKIEEQKAIEKAKKERIFTIEQIKKILKFLIPISKGHYNNRNYTQESMNELRLLGCLTLNEYDHEKVLNKIKELEMSIQ